MKCNSLTVITLDKGNQNQRMKLKDELNIPHGQSPIFANFEEQKISQNFAVKPEPNFFELVESANSYPKSQHSTVKFVPKSSENGYDLPDINFTHLTVLAFKNR